MTQAEFKKAVQKSRDPMLLEIEMEKLINASKEMTWKTKKKEIRKKDEGEKALCKVWNEFSRYIQALKKNPKNAEAMELMDALSEIERLIESLQVV